MEKKEYNIKCGVCGTEFYILDEKCPNCRAKNQSRLFDYLSRNDTFVKIRHVFAAVYSFPGLIASVFLFLYGYCLLLIVGIGVFLGPIVIIVDLGGYIFTGEHLLNLTEYHQAVTSVSGFQNYFLLNFLVVSH